MRVGESEAFLSAEWRHLAMLNYEVEPGVLSHRVPRGTELDAWNGRTFVSVVGFLFLSTRVWGCRMPFHEDFEEVNLRFYVRRRAAEGWRRGVVFIKEIVPRRAIAWVARRLYHEPYVALPMSHRVEEGAPGIRTAEYRWRTSGWSNRLWVRTGGVPAALVEGSEAEFITEHYWGYNRQPDGSTLEYRVEHPRWQVSGAADAVLECEVAGLYGAEFRSVLVGAPSSAFLAEGSGVTVYRGQRLPS